MDAASAELQPAQRESSAEWKPPSIDPVDSSQVTESAAMAHEGLVNFRREVVVPCIARCEAWIEKHMKEAGFNILS